MRRLTPLPYARLGKRTATSSTLVPVSRSSQPPTPAWLSGLSSPTPRPVSAVPLAIASARTAISVAPPVVAQNPTGSQRCLAIESDTFPASSHRPWWISSRRCCQEYPSSGFGSRGLPTLRSTRRCPAVARSDRSASRSPSSISARTGRPVRRACWRARSSRSSAISTVVLMSTRYPCRTAWATASSAADDVRRRHAPSDEVLGIAGQNDRVPVEGYGCDVAVDDVACAWRRRRQCADAAARLRVERQFSHEVAGKETRESCLSVPDPPERPKSVSGPL